MILGNSLGEILPGNLHGAKWLEQGKTRRVILRKLGTLLKGELLLGICIEFVDCDI